MAKLGAGAPLLIELVAFTVLLRPKANQGLLVLFPPLPALVKRLLTPLATYSEPLHYGTILQYF